MLAVIGVVMFSASGLMSGEPAAQTASTNGKIAYVGFDAETEKQDVYSMNPDGTGVSNLTRRYTDPNWSPLGNAHSDPEWSPDGTKISFMSRRAGQDDVWVVDAPPQSPTSPVAALLHLSLGTDAAWAASEPRNLTPGSGVEARSPDWGTAPSTSGNTCTIKGTSAANTITGTSDADVICAMGGNDTVYGAGGADVIEGGKGADTLNGQGGADRVIGDSGSDKLFGGYGDDRVNSRDGVSSNDTLDGGAHISGDTKVADATERLVVGFPLIVMKSL